MVLQQKPLEKADFIVTITGPVMVRPASSDKWKAPSVKLQYDNRSSHLKVISPETRVISSKSQFKLLQWLEMWSYIHTYIHILYP